MFIMKGFRMGLVSLVICISFFLTTGLSAAAEKKNLNWGTTATTSGAFVYFVTTAKILNENVKEINVTVRSTGGSVHNTRLLQKGEVDWGAIDTATSYRAMKGEAPFKKPFTELRLLYVLATNPLQFVVAKKIGAKTINDLDGKVFTPGMLGSSAEQAAMSIFDLFGVHPKIRHSSYADAIESMKNGSIDGFAKFAVPDASILNVASAVDIDIISFSDDQIEKIIENVPGFRKSDVPAGMYPGVGSFTTVENEWADFTTKDFPEDLAYKIVKTVWEHRAEIKKGSSMFIEDRMAPVTVEVKRNFLHPGAVKFFREIGYTIPKDLIPPEMGQGQ